jgi:hypothetical protein
MNCGVELRLAAASAYRSLAWAVDEGGCLLRRVQHTGGEIALFTIAHVGA